jgi:IS30 family transposase
MKLSYKRLTQVDRILISKMIQLGFSQSRIAKEIGCHKSTISREIRFFKESQYCVLRAQHRSASAALSRRHGKCKILLYPPLREFVFEKLMLRWSPEQIHLYLKKHYSTLPQMQISMESIYFYIYVHAKPELHKLLKDHLRQKRLVRGNTRRGQDKRTTIVDATSIDERPAEVQGRQVPGHWEGDLIIGKDHNSAIATLNERSSRAVIIIKLKKRDAKSVRLAMEREFKKIPIQMKKSMTYDRGSEMAEHKIFTKNSKIKVYFAHPYSPWERPTNENSNGLIRDYFPKGTDFNLVTTAELKRVQDELNERPRKVLDMCTPKEVFDKYVMEGL